MRIKVLLLILISVLSISSLTGQKKNTKILITGTVLDASQYPVPNAIVMIDGQNTSSMTDFKSYYKIKVRQDAKMIGIVSFANGMIEEAIDGRTEINFHYRTSGLQQESDQSIPQGEQSVNTGYDVQKRSDATSPLKTVNGTDKKYATLFPGSFRDRLK